MDYVARRINRLTSSPVRDILHLIDQPGMISFAGGLPAGDSFPPIELGSIDQHQLQYGATEGEYEIRELISRDLLQLGLPVSPQQVLLLSGSQQGIDLVAKLMIETGTRVAVESPAYLAALQVFSLFGADYVTYSPPTIGNLNNENPAALTYAVPTFQNPTGHCYSPQQRQALATYCDNSGSVLFEDDPYRELVYEKCARQPVCSYLNKARWIYQSSFSKTFAPGLRLGYLACSPDLFPALSWLKQAADLHTNRLSQHIVLQHLNSNTAAVRLAHLRDSYRRKRDLFDAALNRHIGELARWQRPAGGLFFWLTLKSARTIDTRLLLAKALRHNVAFMPGEPFYADGRKAANSLRLNFSHATAGQVDQGLSILAQLVREVS